MFYQEKKIANVLKCLACKEPYVDVIKCLPCGNSICIDCASQLQLNNNNEYKCKACNQIHEMPKNGLPNNNQLMQLLDVEPEKVTRSTKVEQMTSLINSLYEEKCELQFSLNNRDQTIRNYCENLLTEININNESAVEHLNNLKEAQVKQVKDYERELLASNSNQNEIMQIDEEKSDLEAIFNKIDSFKAEWQDYLHKAVLDEKEIDTASLKANQLRHQLEKYQNDLRALIFKNNYLKLISNESYHNSNDHLGTLVSSTYFQNKSKFYPFPFLFLIIVEFILN